MEPFLLKAWEALPAHGKDFRESQVLRLSRLAEGRFEILHNTRDWRLLPQLLGACLK